MIGVSATWCGSTLIDTSLRETIEEVAAHRILGSIGDFIDGVEDGGADANEEERAFSSLALL